MTKSEKRKKLMADLSALEDEKEELEETSEELEEESEEAKDEGLPKKAKELKKEASAVSADAASVQALIELLKEDLKTRGVPEEKIQAASRNRLRRG